MSLEDKAKEDEVFYVMVGELSTHFTLKHIHPEHISTIAKQLWDVAVNTGRKQALKDMIEGVADLGLNEYGLEDIKKIAEDLGK